MINGLKYISQNCGWFVVLLVLIAATPTWAQSLPLNNLSLRLVPRHHEVDEIGTKTIVTSQSPAGIKVTWYSLIKEYDEEAYYPTFKIKTRKGLIDSDGLSNKTSFFQPMAWGMGYMRAETALPLWVDPEYLNLKGKTQRQFNVGLLDVNRQLIRLAPDKIFETLSFFQSLYDQYVLSGRVRSDVGLNRRDQKEMERFITGFFLIHQISSTKTSLYIGVEKQEFGAKILGNDYFQLTVLEDSSNPLVVSFKIFPDEAPKVLRKVFKDLQKYFEFRITQINAVATSEE